MFSKTFGQSVKSFIERWSQARQTRASQRLKDREHLSFMRFTLQMFLGLVVVALGVGFGEAALISAIRFTSSAATPGLNMSPCLVRTFVRTSEAFTLTLPSTRMAEIIWLESLPAGTAEVMWLESPPAGTAEVVWLKSPPAGTTEVI